jgi:hypothetical protein
MIGKGKPLVATAEGCALGIWGTLVFLAGGACGVQNPEGKRHSLDILPPDIPELGGWLNEEPGLLILATNESEIIFAVDLGMDELRSGLRSWSGTGARLPDRSSP